ncbi:unnamed protein product [Bursaphelenchus okinawaensis]|uniref:Uncharacterized protein n=1 Tax=Bursaphelenchus okinawaensis TaxID=465554 RepID=A0A811KMY6_9BILA|nr:unnamed protein product [Bursaphelenchus okinawaensis]CAG9106935.1 unnamed protein product [Bursaphelenchus okinawaensis]
MPIRNNTIRRKSDSTTLWPNFIFKPWSGRCTTGSFHIRLVFFVICIFIHGTTGQWPSYEVANARFPGQCDEQHHFDCGFIGDHKCIPLSQVHDGKQDCPDKSDEFCYPGQIMCGQYCANLEHLADCLTNPKCDDEGGPKFVLQPSFCPNLKRKLCRLPNTLPCKGYGECVFSHWFLNNRTDCFDGSDEDPEYANLFLLARNHFQHIVPQVVSSGGSAQLLAESSTSGPIGGSTGNMGNGSNVNGYYGNANNVGHTGSSIGSVGTVGTHNGTGGIGLYNSISGTNRGPNGSYGYNGTSYGSLNGTSQHFGYNNINANGTTNGMAHSSNYSIHTGQNGTFSNSLLPSSNLNGTASANRPTYGYPGSPEGNKPSILGQQGHGEYNGQGQYYSTNTNQNGQFNNKFNQGGTRNNVYGQNFQKPENGTTGTNGAAGTNNQQNYVLNKPGEQALQNQPDSQQKTIGTHGNWLPRPPGIILPPILFTTTTAPFDPFQRFGITKPGQGQQGINTLYPGQPTLRPTLYPGQVLPNDNQQKLVTPVTTPTLWPIYGTFETTKEYEGKLDEFGEVFGSQTLKPSFSTMSTIHNIPTPNQNQNLPYSQNANGQQYPYGQPNQYPGSQNLPYSGIQNLPYLGSQGLPYPGNQNLPYPGSQNLPYPGNQNLPYPANQYPQPGVRTTFRPYQPSPETWIVMNTKQDEPETATGISTDLPASPPAQPLNQPACCRPITLWPGQVTVPPKPTLYPGQQVWPGGQNGQVGQGQGQSGQLGQNVWQNGQIGQNFWQNGEPGQNGHLGQKAQNIGQNGQLAQTLYPGQNVGQLPQPAPTLFPGQITVPPLLPQTVTAPPAVGLAPFLAPGLLPYQNLYPPQGKGTLYPGQGVPTLYPGQGIPTSFPGQGVPTLYPGQVQQGPLPFRLFTTTIMPTVYPGQNLGNILGHPTFIPGQITVNVPVNASIGVDYGIPISTVTSHPGLNFATIYLHTEEPGKEGTVTSKNDEATVSPTTVRSSYGMEITYGQEMNRPDERPSHTNTVPPYDQRYVTVTATTELPYTTTVTPRPRPLQPVNGFPQQGLWPLVIPHAHRPPESNKWPPILIPPTYMPIVSTYPPDTEAEKWPTVKPIYPHEIGENVKVLGGADGTLGVGNGTTGTGINQNGTIGTDNIQNGTGTATNGQNTGYGNDLRYKANETHYGNYEVTGATVSYNNTDRYGNENKHVTDQNVNILPVIVPLNGIRPYNGQPIPNSNVNIPPEVWSSTVGPVAYTEIGGYHTGHTGEYQGSTYDNTGHGTTNGEGGTGNTVVGTGSHELGIGSTVIGTGYTVAGTGGTGGTEIGTSGIEIGTGRTEAGLGGAETGTAGSTYTHTGTYEATTDNSGTAGTGYATNTVSTHEESTVSSDVTSYGSSNSYQGSTYEPSTYEAFTYDYSTNVPSVTFPSYNPDKWLQIVPATVIASMIGTRKYDDYNCQDRISKMSKDTVFKYDCQCPPGQMKTNDEVCVRAPVSSYSVRVKNICNKEFGGTSEDASLIALMVLANDIDVHSCVRDRSEKDIVINTVCDDCTVETLSTELEKKHRDFPDVDMEIVDSPEKLQQCSSDAFNDCDEGVCIPIGLRYTCMCRNGTVDVNNDGRKCTAVGCTRFFGICVIIWVILLLLMCCMLPCIVALLCYRCGCSRCDPLLEYYKKTIGHRVGDIEASAQSVRTGSPILQEHNEGRPRKPEPIVSVMPTKIMSNDYDQQRTFYDDDYQDETERTETGTQGGLVSIASSEESELGIPGQGLEQTTTTVEVHDEVTASADAKRDSLSGESRAGTPTLWEKYQILGEQFVKEEEYPLNSESSSLDSLFARYQEKELHHFIQQNPHLFIEPVNLPGQVPQPYVPQLPLIPGRPSTSGINQVGAAGQLGTSGQGRVGASGQVLNRVGSTGQIQTRAVGKPSPLLQSISRPNSIPTLNPIPPTPLASASEDGTVKDGGKDQFLLLQGQDKSIKGQDTAVQGQKDTLQPEPSDAGASTPNSDVTTSMNIEEAIAFAEAITRESKENRPDSDDDSTSVSTIAASDKSDELFHLPQLEGDFDIGELVGDVIEGVEREGPGSVRGSKHGSLAGSKHTSVAGSKHGSVLGSVRGSKAGSVPGTTRESRQSTGPKSILRMPIPKNDQSAVNRAQKTNKTSAMTAAANSRLARDSRNVGASGAAGTSGASGTRSTSRQLQGTSGQAQYTSASKSPARARANEAANARMKAQQVGTKPPVPAAAKRGVAGPSRVAAVRREQISQRRSTVQQKVDKSKVLTKKSTKNQPDSDDEPIASASGSLPPSNRSRKSILSRKTSLPSSKDEIPKITASDFMIGDIDLDLPGPHIVPASIDDIKNGRVSRELSKNSLRDTEDAHVEKKKRLEESDASSGDGVTAANKRLPQLDLKDVDPYKRRFLPESDIFSSVHRVYRVDGDGRLKAEPSRFLRDRRSRTYDSELEMNRSLDLAARNARSHSRNSRFSRSLRAGKTFATDDGRGARARFGYGTSGTHAANQPSTSRAYITAQPSTSRAYSKLPIIGRTFDPTGPYGTNAYNSPSTSDEYDQKRPYGRGRYLDTIAGRPVHIRFDGTLRTRPEHHISRGLPRVAASTSHNAIPDRNLAQTTHLTHHQDTKQHTNIHHHTHVSRECEENAKREEFDQNDPKHDVIEDKVHEHCLTDRKPWDSSPLRESELKAIPLDWNITNSESLLHGLERRRSKSYSEILMRKSLPNIWSDEDSEGVYDLRREKTMTDVKDCPLTKMGVPTDEYQFKKMKALAEEGLSGTDLADERKVGTSGVVGPHSHQKLPKLPETTAKFTIVLPPSGSTILPSSAKMKLPMLGRPRIQPEKPRRHSMLPKNSYVASKFGERVPHLPPVENPEERKKWMDNIKSSLNSKLY